MAHVRRPQVIAALAVLAAVLCGILADARAAGAQVRNLAQPGAFAVEAPAGMSFEKRGRIEQQTAGGWKTVFDEFYLVEDCAAVATLPACVATAPGTALRPVAWNGFTCFGQCLRACKKNIYRPPGTFRLVLTACGSAAQVNGPPFSMKSRAKE